MGLTAAASSVTPVLVAKGILPKPKEKAKEKAKPLRCHGLGRCGVSRWPTVGICLHISGAASISVANSALSRLRLVLPLNCAFIPHVLDDSHVFSTTATARHAHGSPRDAATPARYASCYSGRSFELSFTPRGALLEVPEVDSDAEEALRAKEERRLCRHGKTGAL